jgi:hypothetical protein
VIAIAASGTADREARRATGGGRGVGKGRLAAAGTAAREAGGAGVHRQGLAFQPPGFSARLGDRKVGRLPGLPPGAAWHRFAEGVAGSA